METEETQTPTVEIVITDAMLDAGSAEMNKHNSFNTTEDELLERIFRAMCAEARLRVVDGSPERAEVRQ